MIVYRMQQDGLTTDMSGLSLGSQNTTGRWHCYDPIIYTTESVALAKLELLTHFVSVNNIGVPYNVIQINIPDSISIKNIIPELKPDWKSDQAYTQLLSKEWLVSNESCVLKVPSVHSPTEHNFLINIKHPDFEEISIMTIQKDFFDKRLFKKE